jgi:hypothetical protein
LRSKVEAGAGLGRGGGDAASRTASEKKKKKKKKYVSNSFKLLSDGYRLSRLSQFSHWLLQLSFP